jgi:hypothetical protein
MRSDESKIQYAETDVTLLAYAVSANGREEINHITLQQLE